MAEDEKELSREKLEEVTGGRSAGSVAVNTGGTSGVGNLGPADDDDLNPDPPGSEG